MPLLSRNSGRLLRQVNGQDHATADDHADNGKPAPSSPLSPPQPLLDEEDLTREPDSDSDGESQPSPTEPNKDSHAPSPVSPRHSIRNSRSNLNDQAKAQESRNGLSKAGTKRKEPDDSKGTPFGWLSGSQTKKTARRYGSQAQRAESHSFKKLKSSPVAEKQKAPLFKRPGHLDSSPALSSVEPTSSQSGFRLPKAGRIVADGNGPAAADLALPDLPSSPDDIDLTPPSSIVEEVYIDGDNPSNHEPCPMCEELVEKDFKLEWEVENCRGKRMSLKLQERFCQAHRERSAKQGWSEKGYPEVDWEALPRRLKQHRKRIDGILEGKVESSLRTDLERKVNIMDSRTVTKLIDAGDKGTIKAGYYGARGAKTMSDFASQTFSAKLRKLAKKDELLAASGVVGGLSGFVQAVIVPELALSLIAEDMGKTLEEARKVLDESSDLGDMVNIEEDERLPLKRVPSNVTYGTDDPADWLDKAGDVVDIS